jgi:hypothetical protein
MYRTMLLNSDGLVSFYVGGDMTDGYKRKCLLLLANYFFTSLFHWSITYFFWGCTIIMPLFSTKMNYVALWIGIPFFPVSSVEQLYPGVPLNWLKVAKCPWLFFSKSYETTKSLRMSENFNVPTVAKNIYSSRTAINQPLRGRSRTGRGGCVGQWL